MSTIDFHSLAKTELHCHLDGSLSLPIIRQLAAMANIDLPASDDLDYNSVAKLPRN